MLSRHNIRVKVLQTLYVYTQTEGDTSKNAERNYMQAIHDSYRLYLFSMLYLQKVATYALKDFEIKSNKLVPTEEDKKASLKLYENPIIQSILENGAFQRLLKKEKLMSLPDTDLVRKLFKKFSQSEYYQQYLDMKTTPMREHQYALVNLYKTMLEDEVYVELMEDYFPTWVDDKSLAFGALKRSIRSLPDDDRFFITQEANSEFVHEFGKELLYLSIRHDEELREMIVPKLKNWKEDRVAIIDMLLLKLGICEFLHFPSVPTKVTINEYVSLAKEYSTDKSKRFVNGILDRLMKELMDEGKINKEGRGLKDK
ncbi:MAG: transcription antitermination factor NusB [Aureispira sp.]|nr:transcription antitermination factor NusB [Aureispira sp.]